jgi:hypothetical protein
MEDVGEDEVAVARPDVAERNVGYVPEVGRADHVRRGLEAVEELGVRLLGEGAESKPRSPAKLIPLLSVKL